MVPVLDDNDLCIAIMFTTSGTDCHVDKFMQLNEDCKAPADLMTCNFLPSGLFRVLPVFKSVCHMRVLE